MSGVGFVEGAWITIVLLAAAFVVYTYAGYPLAIHALGRWRQRGAPIGPITAQITAQSADPLADPLGDALGDAPAVVVIIVARHEAERIAAKIASCLALEHPADRLSVLVAIDGPDEATAAAVRACADPRVRLLAFDRHRGKAACLNDAVAASTEPVLLMTDARQRLDPAALRHLLAALRQPGVGAVSGELMFEVADDDGVGQGIDAYWRYEKFIRRAESAAGSVVGVTGALYAIRRAAYQPIPAGTILDDVLIPMRAVMAGWRVGFESRAMAWDRPSQSLEQEQRRKIRTLAGNLQLVELEPGLLDPRRNPILVAFLSHKLFRLAVPFALLALLIGSAVLAPSRTGFALLLAGQLAGYALAVAATRLPALRRWLPARLASTFLTMNVSALRGVFAWLRGDGLALWGAGEPSPPSRPVRRVVYLVSLFPCWSETFIVREIEALLACAVDVRIVSLKPASETLVQDDARRLLDRVTYPPQGLAGFMAGTRTLLSEPRRSLSEATGLIAALATRPVELLKSLVTWWRTLAMTEAVRAWHQTTCMPIGPPTRAPPRASWRAA